MNYRFLFSLLIILPFSSESFSDDVKFSGTVIGVFDGDTFKVLLKDREQVQVRLYGIDCPELHQAYGSKAKQYASSLVMHKTVEVLTRGTDSYGRTLGIIICNNLDLNKEMVRVGLAWAYVYYSTQYLPLEQDARARKIGLWGDNNPVSPWEFRLHRKRINAPAQK